MIWSTHAYEDAVMYMGEYIHKTHKRSELIFMSRSNKNSVEQALQHEQWHYYYEYESIAGQVRVPLLHGYKLVVEIKSGHASPDAYNCTSLLYV